MLFETADGRTVHLSYEYGGLFETTDNWIHSARVIHSYEIILVLQGVAHIYEENKRFSVGPGEILLLRPGVEHGGWRVTQGGMRFYWIHFLTDDFPSLGVTPGKAPYRDGYRLESAFRQLLHVANAPGAPSYACEAALALLLAQMRMAEMDLSRASSKLVGEVSGWIQANSIRRLTVLQVAERFSYHPDHLCVLFQKNFGMSLKQYINSEHLKRLRALLCGPLSIKEIASQCGYGNESQLVHFFKYHEGISPAGYRNLYSYIHMNAK